ncbi:hypothetical protein QFZ28_003097 [Neobacillus niacini]|uniref:hypothetical protein n=1 Tax=Neobacillus niacini TaxID=86668 RepID=UPI002784CD4E|nr:hypothetical protein [Neobacillus niacini]MDQ1002697.1 hypothetical protein [Neobacillus niacini]
MTTFLPPIGLCIFNTLDKKETIICFLLDEKFTPNNVYNKVDVKETSLVQVEEQRDIPQDGDDDADEEQLPNIKQKSKLSPKEIEEYVGNLKSTAEHWYNTFNPFGDNQLTAKERLWIDRLNRIGIAYFRPLVTVSFISKGVDTTDRILLFKEIERFIFIAFRLGRAFTTFRNNEFYKTARQLRNGEITINQICSLLRQRLENWLKPETGFDYQPFKTYIQRLYKNGHGFYEWNGLRYFLYEYEAEKVHQFGNQKIDWQYFTKSEKDKVSVEHIYPQTANNDYWIEKFKTSLRKKKQYLRVV